MNTPMVEVEQVGTNAYVVNCSVHGLIRPESGKVWVSHIAAGIAAAAHQMFVFHGKGAR